MKQLDNLRIAGKVALSSGSILVLFLISSAMAIWGLTTARSGFADYRSLTAQTNAASRVQAELQAASIGVKDFIISGRDEAAEAVTQRLSGAEAAIAEALAVIADADTRAVV